MTPCLERAAVSSLNVPHPTLAARAPDSPRTSHARSAGTTARLRCRGRDRCAPNAPRSVGGTRAGVVSASHTHLDHSFQPIRIVEPLGCDQTPQNGLVGSRWDSRIIEINRPVVRYAGARIEARIGCASRRRGRPRFRPNGGLKAYPDAGLRVPLKPLPRYEYFRSPASPDQTVARRE